ncbi:MAG TPA: HNH endonuclease signature motif containing protein [Roseomonas sp.]|nr:HNH endonuclease signature motif containing protein [Roseomonas sp.]
MPSRPPIHRPAHQASPIEAKRQHRAVFDAQRGSASSRGYDRQWRRLRDVVLAEEPLCRFCLELGRLTPAREVDHIEPIARRPDLRLVRTNLRPLCTPCHSRRTGRDRGRPGA